MVVLSSPTEDAGAHAFDENRRLPPRKGSRTSSAPHAHSPTLPIAPQQEWVRFRSDDCESLQNGFHVICEKPLSISLEEAKELKQIKDSKNHGTVVGSH